jgi:hypothetical protein
LLDPTFGYEAWESLSNPDVYVLEGAEVGSTFSWKRSWA